MPAVRSEDHILDLLDECFARAHPSLVLGRGDDCAELAAQGCVLALSTDIFLEDEHFRRGYFLPEEIGHKALAVNLSDLAASGAAPLGFSLGLICPPGLDAAWLSSVFQGMAALAGRYNLALSGGDISAGSKLGFCITIWGRPQNAGKGAALLRRGAAPGRELFVVGPDYSPEGASSCVPGLARLGLRLLEARGREAEGEFPQACAALLRPWPQIEAGQALAALASPQAPRLSLMDISDGLARDLPRLLRGRDGAPLGADLDIPCGLLHPEMLAWANNDTNLALELILSGGDDYLLLGSAEPDLLPCLRAALAALPEPARLDRIGRVTASPGLTLRGTPLEQALPLTAFDHFTHSASLRPGGEAWAREELVRACSRAGHSGFFPGRSGNASLRLGACCLVTAGGVAKASLSGEDLSILRIEDGSVLRAGPRPSSELGLHLEIYRHCPSAGAVLHTHPKALLALSLRYPGAGPGPRIALPLFEAELGPTRMAFIPRLAPGGKELALAAGRAARQAKLLWLEGHGLCVWAPTLDEALALTEEAERLAEIALLL